ncbi:MAG: SUMF1/EgtB/PvdO family nonheme iron enzyme [Chloroflexota bacterium]
MAGSFVGKTIGKYRVVELIAWGGMAEVYKAHQQGLDRYVAVKVMHPFLAQDEGFLARFQREAKAVAQLRHPNIVQVFDFDVTPEGNYYMVMEFIDGPTLEARLHTLTSRDEIMPLAEAIRIARQVALALAYAHSHEMVHRDVKPSNVMIGPDGQVILTDFGIAKMLSHPQYTASGAMIGTPSYISPEQGLGEPGDARSDIYSLGVMFFQMVTGRLPYEAEKPVAVVFKHINDPVPIPSRVNPSLPEEVDQLIFQAMAKRLKARYQTVAELIEQLERVPVGRVLPEVVSFAFDDTAEMALSADVLTAGVATPTLPVVALSSTVRLTPYTLSPGHVVTSPADLVAACDADWERAVEHFVRGYISEWLREGVSRLRSEHQHGPADELELLAVRAEAIVQRIGSGDHLARNAGLEEYLEFLGATLPVMSITPRMIDLPEVGLGETGEPQVLTINNKGRGYLFGTVVCQSPWLKAEPVWFGCAAGQSQAVTLIPNLSNLSAGRVEALHGLQVCSISGDQHIPVRVDILPALLQLDRSLLDFGAVGQGEVAQATFTLRNSGRGFLTGRIRSRVPWLVAIPDGFRLLAGHSLQITVEMAAETLPPGDVTNALAVVVESDGGYAVLGIRAEILPPQLGVEPTQIDLGVIDLAQADQTRAAELAVSNVGPGVLDVAVTLQADWLVAEPSTVRCCAGEMQLVRLSTARLQVGHLRQMVSLDSNAGRVELPVSLEVCFSLEPEMVCVPAGGFLRGSPERAQESPDAEKPQREIELSEYWIGRYPVTNAQYGVFVRATGRRPPEHWPLQGMENHPVVNVTWWDAVAFCRWLSEVTGKDYRLPTEAEWEKAARGIDGRHYPWGNKWQDGTCNAGPSGKRGTSPVGSYSPAGDSPYGCADMAGNVLEWVFDWYDAQYYSHSSMSQNPFGPASGAVRGLRGGSWSARPKEVRCASRFNANPTLASPEAGFRCAHS